MHKLLAEMWNRHRDNTSNERHNRNIPDRNDHHNDETVHKGEVEWPHGAIHHTTKFQQTAHKYKANMNIPLENWVQSLNHKRYLQKHAPGYNQFTSFDFSAKESTTFVRYFEKCSTHKPQVSNTKITNSVYCQTSYHSQTSLSWCTYKYSNVKKHTEQSVSISKKEIISRTEILLGQTSNIQRNTSQFITYSAPTVGVQTHVGT